MPPRKRAAAGAVADVPAPPTRPSRKRKEINYAELDGRDSDFEDSSSDAEVVEVPQKQVKRSSTAPKQAKSTGHQDAPIVIDEKSSRPRPKPKKKTAKKKKRVEDIEYDDEGHELRLKDFESEPSDRYINAKAKALRERLCLLDRERCGTEDCPEEKVQIGGTTGNIYEVHIKRLLKCTCPAYLFKREPCKHVLYVMLKTLKAPEELAYQTALLPHELRDLFAKAPPVPSAHTEEARNDGNRKTIEEEDECPICYMEFDVDKENITYCKAACGKNVHRACIDRWLQTKQASHAKPTCPYCRSEWVESDPSKALNKDYLKGATKQRKFGYMNNAAFMGIVTYQDDEDDGLNDY